MAYLKLIKICFSVPYFLRYPMGGAEIAFFKNIFGNILSLTGVESGFFADFVNTYPDLPFEQLKLNLCANAIIGRK